MAVTPADINELKRIATNTYDSDKACMNRVIRAIEALHSEIRKLTVENQQLKEQLKANSCSNPPARSNTPKQTATD